MALALGAVAGVAAMATVSVVEVVAEDSFVGVLATTSFSTAGVAAGVASVVCGDWVTGAGAAANVTTGVARCVSGAGVALRMVTPAAWAGCP